MNILRRFGNFLHVDRKFLLFVALTLVFRSSYADWMIVPTGSMNPTILEGDYIFADKQAYGWRIPFTKIRVTQGSDPQRGEIAVFFSPQDGTQLVKRVIGVPGDIVEMRNEQLYLNGEPLRFSDAPPLPQSQALLSRTQELQPKILTEHLDEAPHAVMLTPQLPALRNFGPIVVATNQYLMLGDNRDNSADSRYFGLVPRDLFVGRAHHVLFSFNPERYYLPRISRLWQPLK